MRTGTGLVSRVVRLASPDGPEGMRLNTTPLPAGSLRATSLNAGRRAAELSEVASGDTFDVLVVGGGVTGAGVALDAASRGLSVVLAEAEDLSCDDARIVHSGLDDSFPIGLARRNAVERKVLMTRTAPHLVRAFPELLPVREGYSQHVTARLRARLRAADALRRATRTPGELLPAPTRLAASQARALVPGLRRGDLRGGFLSYACRLSDTARLSVALARTAAGFGARILTRVRVTSLAYDGAEAVDQLTGEELNIHARSVVNTTGGRTSEYLVVDAEAAGLAGTGVCAPIGPTRFVVLLPDMGGRAYLGVSGESPDSGVDFLLDAANTVLEQPLLREHVIGAFGGSRSGGGVASPAGVVTVTGGDPMAYRRVAAETVDAAVHSGGLAAGPSRTDEIALVGAAPRAALASLEAEPRLVSTYGTEAMRIVALTELDPDLAGPLVPVDKRSGVAVTASEVVWAIRHEGALSSDDVLDRRTRIGVDPRERAAAREAVADLVARALEGVRS